jgi:plastocyanin
MTAVHAGPGRLVAIVIAILAAAASVGAIAALTGHDDAATTGDLPVAVRSFAFEPPALEATAGEVAVIVHNHDAARHDFTIDGIVSLDIPGKRTRRATFPLDPGQYTYWCTLHPTMTGQLHIP